jgi:hypothetical protein
MELKERKSLCKADRGKYRYTEVFYRGCIDILFLSDIVVIVHFSYRFFWLDSFRASSYIIERKAVAARQGRQGRRRLPAVRIKLIFFMGNYIYIFKKYINIYLSKSFYSIKHRKDMRRNKKIYTYHNYNSTIQNENPGDI